MYLAKKNCWKLTEVSSVLYEKSRKGFKEKDAEKNAWDGVATVLEFNLTTNCFYLNSFTSFFEILLFIWLNPLVPGVSNLFYQYLSQILFKVFLKISQY